MDNSRVKFSGSVGRLIDFKKDLQAILNDIETDTVSNEHEVDFEQETIQEKREMIMSAFADLDSKIRDAEIFKSVCELFSSMEAEIVRASTQISLLINENNWLQQEMSDLRRKLDQYDASLVDEQAKTMHLQFLLSTRQKLPSKEDDTILSSTAINSDGQLSIQSANNTSSTIGNNSSKESLPSLSVNSDFILQNIGKELNSGSDANLPNTIKAIQDLVYQYISERQLNQAIPLIRESIDAIEKNVNTRVNTDIATLLSLLALVYKEQMNFDAARDTLNEVLKIMEQIYDTKHPMVAAVLNNLSVLYGQRKQFVQAEILCRRALNIRREHFGENHSDVAKQLTNLAILCQNQYKYTEAREYMEEALKVYKTIFHENHSEVLKVKTNIAINLLKQRKYDESEEIFIQIAKTYYKILASTDDETTQTDDLMKLSDLDDNKKIFDNTTVVSFWSILKNMLILYKKNNQFEQVKLLSSFISNLQTVSDRSSFLSVCKTYPIFVNN